MNGRLVTALVMPNKTSVAIDHPLPMPLAFPARSTSLLIVTYDCSRTSLTDVEGVLMRGGDVARSLPHCSWVEVRCDDIRMLNF